MLYGEEHVKAREAEDTSLCRGDQQHDEGERKTYRRRQVIPPPPSSSIGLEGGILCARAHRSMTQVHHVGKLLPTLPNCIGRTAKAHPPKCHRFPAISPFRHVSLARAGGRTNPPLHVTTCPDRRPGTSTAVPPASLFPNHTPRPFSLRLLICPNSHKKTAHTHADLLRQGRKREISPTCHRAVVHSSRDSFQSLTSNPPPHPSIISLPCLLSTRDNVEHDKGQGRALCHSGVGCRFRVSD